MAGSTSALNTLAGIRVDLVGLRAVAESMRNDLEGGLKARSSQIAHQYAEGVPFGWGPRGSGPVWQAQEDYRRCLLAGAESIVAYVDTSEVMLAAVIEVARRYGTSDALAQARVEDVHREVAAAQRQFMAQRTAENAMTREAERDGGI